MSDAVVTAIEMHRAGSSMAAIGANFGKSAAWVCKQLKAAGYKVQRETNASAFTADQAAFLLAHHGESRKWLAQQVGRSEHAVSQWLQKRGLQAFSRPKLSARICGNCGAEYQPKESTQQFCCTACMGEAKRVHGTAQCANCGTTFTKPNARQKFCSPECGQEGYQKQHIAVRPYEYKGTKMRSTWEVKFAAWLDSQGLTWKYEPTFFALPYRKRYAPDFYVKEHDAFYEIKGWMKADAAEKIRQFRHIYAEHHLLVLTKAALNLYGIKV